MWQSRKRGKLRKEKLKKKRKQALNSEEYELIAHLLSAACAYAIPRHCCLNAAALPCSCQAQSNVGDFAASRKFSRSALTPPGLWLCLIALISPCSRARCLCLCLCLCLCPLPLGEGLAGTLPPWMLYGYMMMCRVSPREDGVYVTKLGRGGINSPNKMFQ